MTCTIIKADLDCKEHAEALVFLLGRYAKCPEGGAKPLSDTVMAQLPAVLARRHDAVSLLAFNGDQAVGLLNAFEGFSTFACRPLLNIHDVYVMDRYRSQGIARQLLEAAEGIARERNCCKMTLEVLSNNAAARSAYRHYGFSAYQLDPRMGQAEFWEKTVPD